MHSVMQNGVGYRVKGIVDYGGGIPARFLFRVEPPLIGVAHLQRMRGCWGIAARGPLDRTLDGCVR
jgi:hypothetical protein